MQLPFFFEEDFPASDNFILSEATSKHIVQVLRIRENENLLITNGKGQLLTVNLTAADKKKAGVRVISKSVTPKLTPEINIGISLLKNTNRFEWFLEKATEIGVSEIVPIICERTEKQHFRYDRMKNIIISAMLQSQQSWLPVLQQPLSSLELIKNAARQHKYIAYCADDKKMHLGNAKNSQGDHIILIGPEGAVSYTHLTLPTILLV